MLEQEDENKEFDDFVRQKLSDLSPVFEEEAWEAMQAKLDQHPPTGGFSMTPLKWLATGLSTMALFFGVYWWYIPQPSNISDGRNTLAHSNPLDSSSAPASSLASPQDTLISITSEASSESDTTLNSKLTEAEPSQVSTHIPQAERPLGHWQKDQIPAKNKAAKEALPPSLNRSTNSDEEQENNRLSLDPRSNPSLPTEQKPIPPAQNAQQTIAWSARASSTLKLLTPTPITSWVALPSRLDTDELMPYVPPTEYTAEPPPLALQGLHRIRVGASIAPELDLIPVAEKHTLSFNNGLWIEYFIRPHWSLNLGISYNQKSYRTQSFSQELNDLIVNFPTGAREQVFLTESTHYQSELLDLPFEFRYYLLSKSKWNLFVGGGFSSYLFLHQRIEKEEAALNGNGFLVKPLTSTITEEQGNTLYPFSTVNLSVGFEFNLGHRLHTQVNPYAKLPLRQVGREGIHITSFGLRTLLLFGL